MKLYKTDKNIIKFSPKAAQFLNGLASNEITKPQSAFLTVHGKIIATFDQLKVSDDEVWAVIESPFVEDILNHLSRYLTLSGVKAEILAISVYFDLAGDYSLKSDESAISQKAGKLVLTSHDLPSGVSEEEFTLFRLKNKIPLHGVDYKDDLLLNVSTTDHVSFTKGCYLGQEPISKVYNRSKPSWRLVVKPESDCSEEEKSKMTSKAADPESRKTIGFVFERNA